MANQYLLFLLSCFIEKRSGLLIALGSLSLLKGPWGVTLPASSLTGSLKRTSEVTLTTLLFVSSQTYHDQNQNLDFCPKPKPAPPVVTLISVNGNSIFSVVQNENLGSTLDFPSFLTTYIETISKSYKLYFQNHLTILLASPVSTLI